MPVELPDPDWYLDNVIVPRGPEQRPLGPMRSWHASRQARADAVISRCTGEYLPVVERALRHGFVVTRAETRQTGLPDAVVRRLVRSGVWCAARYGVLGVTDAAGDHRVRHALAATAAALTRPQHVIGGRSATVLHGVPLLTEPDRPELIARTPSTPGNRGTALIRTAGLPDSDVTTWFGAPVATLARTICDLARHHGVPHGLVAADAALHERLITLRDLHAALPQYTGWPGAQSARRAVSIATPLAESPLESLTRLCIADAGLPPPELQAHIGRYRVDMLWRAQRLVVEADGRVKYRDDELWREKRRQEHIERLGYSVIRVLWDDITRRPHETITRIRTRLQTTYPLS